MIVRQPMPPADPARVADLEATVWSLWCALHTALEVIPASNPVAVVLRAAEEHHASVAESVRLPTAADLRVAA